MATVQRNGKAKRIRPRRDRGEGGLFQRKSDGMYIGVVDIGYGPDGKRLRKTVSSKYKTIAQQKLDDLKANLREHGTAPDASTTVGKWLTYWLDSIAAQRVRPRTMESYRTIVNKHLIPQLGKRRLDQLAPQHVREMNRQLTKDGLAGSYVLKVHRTLAKALKDAQREGRVTRNVATLIDAPKRGTSNTAPLTVEQARQLLVSVAKGPLGGRWAMALLLGARQGECIGLEWDRVDLAAGYVDISWQLQRLRFRHGCGDQDGGKWPCGYARAGSCPKRQPDVGPGFVYRPLAGGLYLTKPKAHERIVPLPPQMAAIFQLLAREQMSKSSPHGLVWTREGGRPIDPRDDAKAWHAALEAAGVPDVNLHAARHTTGTFLLELAVDPQVIQSILGHSSAVSTKGYLHVRQPLQKAAMEQLGGTLAIEANP